MMYILCGMLLDPVDGWMIAITGYHRLLDAAEQTYISSLACNLL